MFTIRSYNLIIKFMNTLIIQINIITITLLAVLTTWYFQIFDNIDWGIQLFILVLVVYLIEFIIILLKQYKGKNFVFLALLLAIIYYILSIYLPELRLGIWANIIVTLVYFSINVTIVHRIMKQ